MTIPRELFEQGLDTLDDLIIKILDSDPENAYSLESLAEQVSSDLSNQVEELRFRTRLVRLATRGFILDEDIGDTTYYASVKQPAP